MAILDMFKKKDAKANPLSMVMDFLSNPGKLKETLAKQIYPAAEKSLLRHMDSVELQENEVMASLILFKKNDEMHYVLCTFDAYDRIVRQLEVENVREKLLEMADNLKIF
jgi:hypothetical protein